MAGNPYLASQASAITNQANQNLTNFQLPAINSGAMAAGGFGGSRQGIAQGLAIGQTNQGITNSLAGLYGNAYAQDQQLQAQRDMQAQSLGAQERIAGMQNQTQRDLGFGNLGLGFTQAGNNFALGMGQLGLGNRQADQNYALGLGGLANTAQANANQFALGAGGLANQRYGMDQNYTLGQQQNANTAQANANSFALGVGNLGLNSRQADQNYALGLGSLGNQQQQTANQFALGQGNLALGNKQADQSYGLGMTNALNNYTLGQQQNANTAQANANQYALGLGNLGLGQMQAQNQFALGNRAADTAQYGAETSRGLGYGQLQQQGDMNTFNQQQAGFNSQLAALNALQGWNNNGINWANLQQQTPLQNLGQLANIGAGIGGQGSTISQPGASTVGSALGGALTAAQLWQLLSGGKG